MARTARRAVAREAMVGTDERLTTSTAVNCLRNPRDQASGCPLYTRALTDWSRTFRDRLAAVSAAFALTERTRNSLARIHRRAGGEELLER